MREGGCFSSISINGPLRERNLFVFNPLFYLFVLILLPLLSSVCMQQEKGSSVIERKDTFALVDEAEGVSFIIKDRKYLNIHDSHRILFQIEISNSLPKIKIKALAQKIVMETISREKCHGISLDFGRYGYADFAPYGNLHRRETIREANYDNFRFTYVFY